MKKIYYLLLAITPFAACKKTVIPVDTGCISQIKRLTFYLPPADSVKAVELLTQNHLPTNDLQIEYIIPHDTVVENGIKNVYQYVYAVQYLNGLAILSSDFGYKFKGGIYTAVDGTRYSNINQDTHPTKSLPQVRSLFLGQLSNKIGANAAAAYKDTCLQAQFGYYDVNVRSTVANHTTDFVMAWMITPKDKLFPQVLIRDDNGSLIAYYGSTITH